MLSDARDKQLQAYICGLKAPECVILQSNRKAPPPLGPGRQGENRSMTSAIETVLEKTHTPTWGSPPWAMRRKHTPLSAL